MNKSSSIIFLHIFGSLTFLSIPVFFSPDFSLSFEFIHIRPFQRDLFTYFLLLLFFYFNFYFLIPKFYFNKKLFLFLGVLILAYPIVFYLPELLFMPHGPHKFIHTPPKHFVPPHMPNGFLFRFSRHLFPYLLVVFSGITIRIYNRWKETEKEKINTELSYLKAQINPHFLFNSLNSIYSLSIEEQAFKSSEAIIKLSHMMRYVLVDSQQEYVSLEKEVNYISSYIELQKIRFGDTVSINYQSPKNNIGYQIAPLVLIPFIENAFKYGVNPETHSTIMINIFTEK